ncbi:kinase-like domain-containing protein [Cantharellus anzutake]|uniref:kinase-like domain-containing protein n=1 Tax=Cantharellus anzutake TaxID=1750568 RepID=UPI001902FECA|nr:kinase-like domain-containing protein [Cantharellus anzutake]KAF8334303.1 kinase-like domain-containing protein [Cantharellus anzutake]
MSFIQELLRAVETRLLAVDSRILNRAVLTRARWKEWIPFGRFHEGYYRGSHVWIKAFTNIAPDTSHTFGERLASDVMEWSQLKHPHVVRLHGWISYVSKENPCPGLVPSWSDGGNIRSFLGGTHDFPSRWALIRGIADGLHHLHLQEIVHGDIQPENIVLSRDGKPQLCDFGLLCIISETSTPIVNPNSWRYSAPELRTTPDFFRNRESDVWAFGCTAMEILLNTPPYSGVEGTELFLPTGPPFADPTDGEILMPCLETLPHARTDMETVIQSLGRTP